MAKFHGSVGYVKTVEDTPGVWKDEVTVKEYCGDLIRNTRKLINAGQVNDSVNVWNEISIVADPYANENFQLMVYASFMGAKWKITNIEVLYPRLLLTIGGLYNAE